MYFSEKQVHYLLHHIATISGKESYLCGDLVNRACTRTHQYYYRLFTWG